MKAKVLSYNDSYYAHYVVTDKGEETFVDIMISGDLPEDISPEDLIGKTIEWETSHAFVSIAHGVKIVQ